MSRASDETSRNPFTARRIAPGTLPYFFPHDDETLDALVDRFIITFLRGEIVGPHGCGKSTLLHSLATRLRERGFQPVVITLAAGQRRMPAWTWPDAADGRAVLMVDGYEQLGFWERWRVNRAVKANGAGLIATKHRHGRLPLLYECLPDRQLAHRIVDSLMEGYPDGGITAEDVDCQYDTSDGDLREMLFSLYDVYEHRRPN